MVTTIHDTSAEKSSMHNEPLMLVQSGHITLTCHESVDVGLCLEDRRGRLSPCQSIQESGSVHLKHHEDTSPSHW